jgi:hypothetical protein
MDQPTNHLTLAAARAWRPDKPAAQLAHLMTCPSCRHAVGRALLFRGLISPPDSSTTTRHLSISDIRRFHEFVFLSDSGHPMVPEDFLRSISHLRTCSRCLAQLIGIDEFSKPANDEIREILSRIKGKSNTTGRLNENHDLLLPIVLGTLDIILPPKGIRVEFLPHPGMPKRLRVMKPPLKLLQNPRSGPAPEAVRIGITSFSKSASDFNPLDAPHEEGPQDSTTDDIEIHLQSSTVRLRFSRHPSGININAKATERSSSKPLSGLRISCHAENPSSRPEEYRLSISTDKAGSAEFRAPGIINSSTSTSSRLSAQGWRLQLTERENSEAFELLLNRPRRTSR